MVNHNGAVSPEMQEFERELRGYNRLQVNEFINNSRWNMNALRKELDQAREEADGAREALARTQVAGTQQPHEQMGDRLTQILKLAEEEAEQKRAEAYKDIQRVRAAVTAEIEQLLGTARQQAAQMVATAESEAQRLEDTARAKAERLLKDSQEDAGRRLSEANEQADRTLQSAEAVAKELVADAEDRTRCLNEVVETRVTELGKTHGRLFADLAAARDQLVGLLNREIKPLEVPKTKSGESAHGQVDMDAEEPLPVVETQAPEEVAAHEDAPIAEDDRSDAAKNARPKDKKAEEPAAEEALSEENVGNVLQAVTDELCKSLVSSPETTPAVTTQVA